MSGDEKAYFFYLTLLLLFVGSGFLFGYRQKLGRSLQQAAINNQIALLSAFI